MRQRHTRCLFQTMGVVKDITACLSLIRENSLMEYERKYYKYYLHVWGAQCRGYDDAWNTSIPDKHPGFEFNLYS